MFLYHTLRLHRRAFLTATSGMAAIVFSVAAPVLFALLGVSVDYGRGVSGRSQLQRVVDSAALHGASMLRLANTSANPLSVKLAVEAQVVGAYADGSVTAQAIVGAGSVTVSASRTVPTMIMKAVMPLVVSAKAKALLRGGAPTCLLVLDPSANQAFSIDTASLSASGCQVFSDSKAPDSITLRNGAQLNAALTCSSGGTSITGGATFSPQPSVDCPALVDPLATLAPPTVGSCISTNLQIKNVSTTLIPGTYCGGIDISGDVTLTPGIYVIKDGPLTMSKGSITGNGVTLYFTGNNAVLNIDKKGSLDLTAPSFGSLAGILLFEDRAAPLGQTHSLQSRYAPNLLGTVYLSRGTLAVGTKNGGGGTGAGVASTSAWTIVVVRQLSISDQQTLVLNTNYNATTVPPPNTLVQSASIALSQ